VISLPEQILVAEGVMETDGVTLEFTVMTTGAEVAVEGVAHVSVDVIIQLMTSPSASNALL